MTTREQNIEQIQQLAGQLTAKADTIANVVSYLTSAIKCVQWAGPEAEQFRSDWNREHTVALGAVVDALRTASDNAAKSARELLTA